MEFTLHYCESFCKLVPLEESIELQSSLLTCPSDFDQFANDLEALGLRKASQGLPLGFKAEPGAALAGSAHAEVGDQGSSTRPLPLAAQPGRILQRPEENSHSVLEKSWFRLALIQTTRCVPMRAIRHQHRQPI